MAENINPVKLSVIIPAYNEEKRIALTLEETDKYLKEQNYGYEIIVVDNGSNDATCDIVKEYQSRGVEKVVRLCLSESIGSKGSAVKYGILEYAQGDFVVFMDADNATPISEIEKFWPFFDKGFSVVIGSRYVKDADVAEPQPFYKIVLSRMSNILIQLVAVRGIKDTQMGFKAFTAKAAHDIFSRVTIAGWGFDIEAFTIARLRGFKIKEAGVLWRERCGSHVPLSGYLQTPRDLLKIKISGVLRKYR